MSEAGPLASLRFRSCIGVFVELPTEIARLILPGDLQPVELYHGASVLSAMAFDYQDTPFGDYRELALGVAVAPHVTGASAMPKSAFFPFAVASTSSSARQFAAAELHLPYHEADMDIRIESVAGTASAVLLDGDRPVVELRATEHEWHDVGQLYQTFMVDSAGLWTAEILMAARFSEHEEEIGWLEVRPHPFTSPLPAEDVESTPFREQVMRDGTQSFLAIRRLAAAQRP